MKIYTAFFLFSLLFLGSCDQITDSINKNEGRKKNPQFKPIATNYPPTYRDSSIFDNYFGKRIYDPYRWLEDINSAATEEWMHVQNQSTFNYLSNIPSKNAIKKRLEQVWMQDTYSLPFKKGENYFFSENNLLLYSLPALDEKAEVVLDARQFSDANASLGSYSLSADGSLLAFEIVDKKSEWGTIFIKDMISGKMLEDSLSWVKFSNISWFRDGFFYSRYPEAEAGLVLNKTNEFHQVYYHKVGSLQADDELIFADRTHPNWKFYTQTTSDERFLVITVKEKASGNALYFKSLKSDEISLTPIVEHFKYDFEVIDNIGNYFLVLTNYRAPNRRIIRVISTYPKSAYWEEIIPEEPDMLQNATVIDGKIVGNYIHNAFSEISIFDRKGFHLNTIPMPEIGTITQFKGTKNSPIAFYEFTSFKRPTTVYQLNLDSLSATIFKAPPIPFDPDAYVTQQLWFKSQDGERIPVFVTHKRELPLDGQRPTLLYGFGGFNVPILPQFNLSRQHLALAFLENDGVFAVANIRGGGEFGPEWHQATIKENKQLTFNDFQETATFLMAQKYTSPGKLAIYGKSNGGLLVGACMSQRPDLYGVALSASGILDMLRYQQYSNNKALLSEYGKSDVAKDFDYLISYSPLHNITKAKYPATFITTNSQNNQVFPAHSFKFAAELQSKQIGTKPILIRVATNQPTSPKAIKEENIKAATDILAFTFYNLKEEVYK